MTEQEKYAYGDWRTDDKVDCPISSCGKTGRMNAVGLATQYDDIVKSEYGISGIGEIDYDQAEECWDKVVSILESRVAEPEVFDVEYYESMLELAKEVRREVFEQDGQ